MATPPTFTAGTALAASSLNAVGLWLTKSVTITGTPSVVDVTSCFSSDYDNYLVSLNGISASGGMSLPFQLLSGSTVIAANYNSTEFYTSVGSTTQTGQISNGANNYVFIGSGTAASGVSSTFNVQSPFLAQHTKMNYTSIDNSFYRYGFGIHQSATSYNGFRLSTSSGTLSGGSITVYGYRK